MSEPVSEPVKPALSAEEWAFVADSLEHYADGVAVMFDEAGKGAVEAYGRLNAAVDSIRIGKPFGLRPEDVALARGAAGFYAAQGVHDVSIWLNDLADRIEALLRPRKDET